ncbi:putative ribonuclease H-like domain-containing protein [Tanacetum coccineum]
MGFNFMNTKIYIDNESTICIVKNPVYHSKTKHIAIRHHFIRDAYEKKLASTPIETQKPLVKDEEASDVDVHLYRSMIGSLMYLTASRLDCFKGALISIFTTISIPSKMAVLDSCPKHNMVAYLEKSEGNVEFHEIIDFLTRSSIHHALTVSPIVSTTFVEQNSFGRLLVEKKINMLAHFCQSSCIFVSISEASIRSDLLFDDADGIDTLPNQSIFDAIQQMGYKGI